MSNKAATTPIPRAELRKARQALESRWNDPSFLSAHEHLFNNYHCEAVAATVLQLEPLVHGPFGGRIVEFTDSKNPGTAHFAGDGEDGHTFAVIRRFVVDPWMFETEGRSVWDMDDPADAEDIVRLYGRAATWVTSFPYPQRGASSLTAPGPADI
jgi:hypothetical protein